MMITMNYILLYDDNNELHILFMFSIMLRFIIFIGQLTNKIDLY